MHFKLKLDNKIVGFAEASARGGERIPLSVRDLLTPADGERLQSVLEEASNVFLPSHSPKVVESRIGDMIAVLHQNCEVDVFINEAKFMAKVQPKHGLTVGDLVLADTIADVREVVLQNIEVPEDAGVFVVMSIGWRRGVFYDFEPLSTGVMRPAAALPLALGSLWSRLLFQDRLRLTELDWSALIDDGWFPFIGLPMGRVKAMVSHLRAGWPMREQLPEIIQETRERIGSIRQLVIDSPLVANHRVVLQKALDHFEANDHVSVVAMLYPRIEGILRDYPTTDPGNKQGKLVGRIANSVGPQPDGLLLPHRFSEYLKDHYFVDFDADAPKGVSRHTVSHGVAPEADMDSKASVLSVLIVEQLMFLAGPSKLAVSIE